MRHLSRGRHLCDRLTVANGARLEAGQPDAAVQPPDRTADHERDDHREDAG